MSFLSRSYLPRLRFLAVLLAMALLAVACGSSGSESSATADPTAEPEAAEPEAAEPEAAEPEAAEPEAEEPEAAEPEAAEPEAEEPAAIDRTGETILIGYSNNEGGAISLPDMRIAGEVAADLINNSGGINGATIELDTCLSDGSPEGAIACANQWIENDVVMAYTGLELGADAMLPLLNEAAIPYVSSNGWGQTEKVNDQAFLLHASQGAYVVGPLLVFGDLGVEKPALITTNNPSGVAFANEVAVPIGQNLGFDYEVILVDPAAPDYAAAVASAQAAGADAIQTILDDVGCISVLTSAATFEGPVFLGACSFYLQLGPLGAGTYNMSDVYMPDVKEFAPPVIQERLTQFEELMTAAGHEDLISGFGPWAYSGFMQVGEKLKMIEGEMTAAAIQDEFANGGTSPGWLGPDLNCGGDAWPTEPAQCRNEVEVYQVEALEDGSVRRVPVLEMFNAFEASGQ